MILNNIDYSYNINSLKYKIIKYTKLNKKSLNFTYTFKDYILFNIQ